MPSLKRLLVSMVVTAALIGLSVPAGADRASGRFDGPVAVEGWGPVVPVPIPKRGTIQVVATAISDGGHVAVAYRDLTHLVEGTIPGFVIVRGRGGGWSAPHRLNPRGTDIQGVEVAFDAKGNLTAAWWFVLPSGECCGEPMTARFEVASKPTGHAWSAHLRVGKTADDGDAGDSVLSVAPSGKAAFFWWRARELEPLQFRVRFMVRVRPAADAPWGPAQALSPAIDSRNRYLHGDVAINNDGTGMAAWSVNAVAPRTGGFRPGTIRRTTPTRSGVWTAPITMTTSSMGGLELESAPNGFTAIKWLRRGQNDTSRTVVANSTGSGWVRGIVGGVHDSLAVGRGGTVVMVKVLPSRQGLQLTWHSSRSEWSTHTLAPTNTAALARELAVDGAGRIVALWSQGRGNYPRNGERAFMSSHLNGWSTAGVYDWTRHAFLAAADVSPNGRAVAIRTVTNTQQTRTAVAMRVFRPG